MRESDRGSRPGVVNLDSAETATRLVSTRFGAGIRMLFDPPQRRRHMLVASIAALAPGPGRRAP